MFPLEFSSEGHSYRFEENGMLFRNGVFVGGLGDMPLALVEAAWAQEEHCQADYDSGYAAGKCDGHAEGYAQGYDDGLSGG
jgi:hypothetical protein